MQRVRIKTWEEMEDVYGKDLTGNIPFGAETFTQKMEEALPEDRIITIDGIGMWDYNDGKGDTYNWSIDPAMIDEYISDKQDYKYIICFHADPLDSTISAVPFDSLDNIDDIRVAYGFDEDFKFTLVDIRTGRSWKSKDLTLKVKYSYEVPS